MQPQPPSRSASWTSLSCFSCKGGQPCAPARAFPVPRFRLLTQVRPWDSEQASYPLKPRNTALFTSSRKGARGYRSPFPEFAHTDQGCFQSTSAQANPALAAMTLTAAWPPGPGARPRSHACIARGNMPATAVRQRSDPQAKPARKAVPAARSGLLLIKARGSNWAETRRKRCLASSTL